jgi:GH15 family glucan-1,4-alpha-glucosidase
MASRIEDYALIGNTRTAALVGRDGSIDWLCLPRFDSEACFAALLGDTAHGRWLLAAKGGARRVERSYHKGSMVLETVMHTNTGTVRIVDCMPHWEGRSDVVRIVEGLSGQVEMSTELCVRFDYGSIVPLMHHGGSIITAGPDSVAVRTRIPLRQEDAMIRADFVVGKNQFVPFVLSYFPSHEEAPLPIDPNSACESTTDWWRGWSKRCCYDGLYPNLVERSLLTLKALTYSPTGGIVAAPTTSLPEKLGGVRNWDYRFCWLRDATFTLYTLLLTGYTEEARAWREWLLRAAAGRPHDLQILYGIAGKRRLSEGELPWLPGYQGAAPVRIGNAASTQRQLDVYGEVMDALYLTRRSDLEPDSQVWQFQRVVLEFLESAWREPDNGIWEVRGPRRHFTHSKVMAWVAFDRAVKSVEQYQLEGPVERWRALRDQIHEEVCRRAYDAERGAFVQHYDGKSLDASALMLPLVGFLSPQDPRVVSTVEAVQRELSVDGLVHRYTGDEALDGLPPGEGVFLPCSFWLVDNLAMLGRYAEARELFERLIGLCNDVGLIAEEYDPRARRLVGNFPQAFTHVSLVNSARNITRGGGPGEHRAQGVPEHPAKS